MRKQYTYKPVALRFRRWSRKRYAAFISIQHAVCPVQIANRPAASYAHIIKDNISEIAEGPNYKLKAFRDFRLYKYPNT